MIPRFIIFLIFFLAGSAALAQTNAPVNAGPKTISGGVLNGRATNLPKPYYPAAAATEKADGAVSVKVLIDEAGNVVSAEAVSGHMLLRGAAVDAARLARFSPTMLSGVPVKVSGVITYNFVLADHPLGIPPEERHLVWAVGFLFSFIHSGGPELIESMGGKEQFTKELADLATDLPDAIKGEQHVFDRFKNASEADLPAAAGDVIKAIKRYLKPNEIWLVDIGEQAGMAGGELVRQLTRIKNGEIPNDSVLRANLNGLHEKLATQPEGVPRNVTAVFAEMARFKDATDLNSEPGLRRLYEAMEPLFAGFEDEK